jgi:ABC-2 type transport system ATP-binding protein
MLVSEYLEFIGEARHLNGKLKKRFDWVVDACGLSSVLNRKIEVLSKGFKQRTCLAQALIHDPDVLILDEPTSGLDPLQIIGIRNLIKDLAHAKTIILSTHILPEVATVADRILVINEGRIVADGGFEDLVSQVTRRSSIYLAVKASRKEVESKLQSLEGLDEVSFESTTPRGVAGCHLYFSQKTDLISQLNELVRDNGWDIVEFQREKLSLEESFIRLTQGGNKKDSGQTSSSDGKGGAE